MILRVMRLTVVLVLVWAAAGHAAHRLRWEEPSGDERRVYIGDGTGGFVPCITEEVASGQLTYSDDPACQFLVAAHKKTQRIFVGALLGKTVRVRCSMKSVDGQTIVPTLAWDFLGEMRCKVIEEGDDK